MTGQRASRGLRARFEGVLGLRRGDIGEGATAAGLKWSYTPACVSAYV